MHRSCSFLCPSWDSISRDGVIRNKNLATWSRKCFRTRKQQPLGRASGNDPQSNNEELASQRSGFSCHDQGVRRIGHRRASADAAGHPHGSLRPCGASSERPNSPGCDCPQERAMKQITGFQPTSIFWTWHEWLLFGKPRLVSRTLAAREIEMQFLVF